MSEFDYTKKKSMCGLITRILILTNLVINIETYIIFKHFFIPSTNIESEATSLKMEKKTLTADISH